jgi:hypothetical protein
MPRAFPAASSSYAGPQGCFGLAHAHRGLDHVDARTLESSLGHEPACHWVANQPEPEKLGKPEARSDRRDSESDLLDGGLCLREPTPIFHAPFGRKVAFVGANPVRNGCQTCEPPEGGIRVRQPNLRQVGRHRRQDGVRGLVALPFPNRFRYGLADAIGLEMGASWEA